MPRPTPKASRRSRLFSAGRRRPTRSPMRPIPPTGCVSACSAAPPTRWIFSRWTVPATVGSCRCWCIPSGQKFTYWKTRRPPVPISPRCGHRQWRSTAPAASGSASAGRWRTTCVGTSGTLCPRTPKPGSSPTTWIGAKSASCAPVSCSGRRWGAGPRNRNSGTSARSTTS